MSGTTNWPRYTDWIKPEKEKERWGIVVLGMLSLAVNISPFEPWLASRLGIKQRCSGDFRRSDKEQKQFMLAPYLGL